ncbi:MAG: PQQ-like beta-propeller repeat protein, partial [Candidatus Krumholzibacteria bacterium]|nr:PQQ-like beta-propeller repeat protein [Candidatus Krumholzibacteria bacterium]
VHCTPLVKGDNLYFGSCDEFLYAVDRNNGNLRWKFKTNGAIITSILGNGDSIIFGSLDCNLYSLTENGRLNWKFPTSSAAQADMKTFDKAVPKEDGKSFNIFDQRSVKTEKDVEKEEREIYGDNRGRYGKDDIEEDGLSSYSTKKKYR